MYCYLSISLYVKYIQEYDYSMLLIILTSCTSINSEYVCVFTQKKNIVTCYYMLCIGHCP